MSYPPREPILILAQLMREEMGLKEEEVVVYNQKWRIPPTGDLFIVVKFDTSLLYAWTKDYDPNDPKGGLVSVQTMNAAETYTVTLYCSEATSRIRKNEVVLALSSDRSERYQEKYQLRIANLSNNFLDTSEVEATARLNRYDISFNVLTSYEKRTQVPFFDSFPTPPEIVIQP